MFTSLPVPFFREFIFKTNLMRNLEKSFSDLKLTLVRRGAGSMTISVTDRIIMKITVCLIPT
jgi:hypothetical protein